MKDANPSTDLRMKRKPPLAVNGADSVGIATEIEIAPSFFASTSILISNGCGMPKTTVAAPCACLVPASDAATERT